MGKKDVPRFFSLPQSSKISFKVPNRSRRRKLNDGNSIPDDAIAPRQDYIDNFGINENSQENIPKIYTPEQTYNYKSAWKRYKKGMELAQQEKVLKDPDEENKYKVLSPKAPKGYWTVKEDNSGGDNPGGDNSKIAMLYSYTALEDTQEACSLTRWTFTPFLDIGRVCGFPDEEIDFFEEVFETEDEALNSETRIFSLVATNISVNRGNSPLTYSASGYEETGVVAPGNISYTHSQSGRTIIRKFQARVRLSTVQYSPKIFVNCNFSSDGTNYGIAVSIGRDTFYSGGNFHNYDYLYTGTLSFSQEIQVPENINNYINIYGVAGCSSLSGTVTFTTTPKYKVRKFFLYDSSSPEPTEEDLANPNFTRNLNIKNLDIRDDYKAYLTAQNSNLIYLDIKGGKLYASYPTFAKVYHQDIIDNTITNPTVEPVNNNNWQNAWTSNYDAAESLSNDICVNECNNNSSNIVDEIIYSLDIEAIKTLIKTQDVQVNIQIINATRENDRCNIESTEIVEITLPRLEYPEGIALEDIELLAISFFPGNGDGNGNGNGNGGDGDGNGNSNGNENNWKCDCPDSSKEEYLSPNETSGNQPSNQQWKDSEAGAQNEQCKHIWAVRILRNEISPEDVPTDMPISENFPTMKGESREARIIGQQGGLGFDNWNPNKQIRRK